MHKSDIHTAGFTLIELMVTVSMVAILGVIAISSYQSVMAKGDRTTAISDIVEITQALERYFSFNLTYTNDFEKISMASSSSFASNDANSLYTYYVAIPGTTTVDSVPQANRNGLSYTIYAKPTSKNRDKWTLSLNDFGLKNHYASNSTTILGGWP
jgi:type IV pilus assembly protein PilE